MSRVWPGIVVSEENIKFQISVLRKALGADRDVIHTEFGRAIGLPACWARMRRGKPGAALFDRQRGLAGFFTQSCGCPSTTD